MQVWIQDWMIKNECAPGQKYHARFHNKMLKWDRTWHGFWDGGTYDVNILEAQLNYIKNEQQICKADNGHS